MIPLVTVLRVAERAHAAAPVLDDAAALNDRAGNVRGSRRIQSGSR